jgi:hypothetical protein
LWATDDSPCQRATCVCANEPMQLHISPATATALPQWQQ